MVTWRVALGFSIAILGTLFALVAGEAVAPQAEAPDSASSTVTRLVGTNSCSARGCHGRIEPLARQRIEQKKVERVLHMAWHHLFYNLLPWEVIQKIIKGEYDEEKLGEAPR